MATLEDVELAISAWEAARVEFSTADTQAMADQASATKADAAAITSGHARDQAKGTLQTTGDTLATVLQEYLHPAAAVVPPAAPAAGKK